MRYLSTILFVICVYSSDVYAQSVSESWLRQAAISCGGGQSEEVRAEVESRLISQLEVTGESRSDSSIVGDVSVLLDQFEEEKTDAYGDYVACLSGLVELAVSASGLPRREVVLDAPIAVAGLNTAQRGDRFVLQVSDTMAIKDWSLIFVLDKITAGNRPSVSFTWSDTSTGQGKTYYAYQGQRIEFGQHPCVLVPYKIEENAASFLVNCN